MFFKKGFTIIELMISISFMIIILVIGVANYRGGEEDLALQREISRLAQNIRGVQAMIGTEETECSHRDDYQYGYGLHFSVEEEKKYTIFADCNGNNRYEESTDKKIRDIELEEGVKIENFSPKQGNKWLNIIFIPPGPKVFVNDNDTVEAEITLQTEEEGNTKKVLINSVGRIEIE